MAGLQQIAAWLGVEWPERSGAMQVDRVSSIQLAGPGAAVFATTPEVLIDALRSSASLILTTAAVCADAPADERVLRVRDPRLAFAELAARLAVPSQSGVHVSALIAASAQVDATATVGPGCIVGDMAVIGPGCLLGARVVVEAGTVLGSRVQVQSGAVLGSWGFGYARRPDGSYLRTPQQGTLVIEDDVEIGANTTIDRGALGETRIGAGTKIDNLVHIGHNCRIGRNVIIAAQTGISGSSVVEDGAILGGQVGIGEHATVGPGVILGGGAGVLSGKKMRGAGEVFWGRPAQPLKQYLRDLARLRRGV